MSEIDDIIAGKSFAAVDSNGQAQGIPQGFSAETAENDQEIEMQFAVKCMEEAETHFKLIRSLKASTLPRLTKWDSELYSCFSTAFPEYLANGGEKLKLLDEDEMKSPEGKKRWREFMMPFEKKIDEYNFGTLLRKNVQDDYTEQNSMF
ncbi:hypothetical protein JCM11641_004814, partial [Rhodosporidiobolus odoratus]